MEGSLESGRGGGGNGSKEVWKGREEGIREGEL